jgi:hypothetical protein
MRLQATLLLALMVLLAGCGGGSSGGFAGGGTSGTGITRGPVGGFSSIIIDGQRYRIGPDTVLVVNGEILPEDPTLALAVGLPVTVYWEQRTASAGFAGDGSTREDDPLAQRVVYDPVVIGPVTQAAGAGPSLGPTERMEVLGVPVVVTPATLFLDADGRSLDPSVLGVDTVVEIAGDPLADGSVLAVAVRRIGSTASGYAGPFEIEGYVTSESGLAGVPQSLLIGGLAIDYSNALGAVSSFRRGDVVVVRAGSFTGFGGLEPKRFFADDIFVKNRGFELPSGEERTVTLSGFVSFRSGSRIVVSGQPVALPAATQLALGIGLGDLVRVEGVFDPGSGLVIPQAIDRVGAAEIAIQDRLHFYDPVTGVLVTELGIRLRTDRRTVFRGDDHERIQPEFDLFPGAPLEIVAARLGSELYAVRVELADFDDGLECDITARVRSLSSAGNELTLFGGLSVTWLQLGGGLLDIGVLVNIDADGTSCVASDFPDLRFGSIVGAESVSVLAEKTFGDEDDGEGDDGDGVDDEDG